MLLIRRIIFTLIGLLASTGAAIAEEAGEDLLSLEAALSQALGNNLGLYAERLSTARVAEEQIIAESAFDWELFADADLNERKAAAASSALDSASVPESETRQFRTGADKRLSTGTSLTLDTGMDRRASNNNAVRNPDYSSDVGLNLRQPLLRGAGQTVNLAPLARAVRSFDRSLFALRGEVLDVLAETELAYWELVRARASRQLVLSSIEQARRLLEENRERERLGIVTPLEVLQAETVLTEREEDLILAERRIEDAVDALATVMGVHALGSRVDLDYEVAELPEQLPGLDPMNEVVQLALANDLDASLQEQTLEIERIDRLLARDATKPQLDLVGGVRYSGRDSDGLRSYRGAVERQDGYNWRAGFEIRFPWGMREAKARLRQAERSVEAAQVALLELKQQKALSARNAWRAVSAGLERIAVARKALELSEATFEQERARYQSGVIAYRNVLEAQRDLDAARANELAVRADTLQALVRLSRIDGTLLERHGYSWEFVDELAEPGSLSEHPLAETRSTDS